MIVLPALRALNGSRGASIVLQGLRTRSFSSSLPRRAEQEEEEVKLTAPACYISTSTDPWFNLSYEDWLLRTSPRNQPILFVYRNIPCVVIGRNQNPWKETTPRYLREIDLPLVRRRSGGGTVYHDLGNTNFSIILPRLLFTRAGGAQLVAKAIREQLKVPSCTVNDRNDVVVCPDTKTELKVSGSAYKIIQHRAYHHGTMLISSDLASLGKALHSDTPNLVTKGIASHRAPVSTINAHRSPEAPDITHESFFQAIREEFARAYPGEMAETVVREEDVDQPKVWNGVEELKSWDWQYGQTPEFTNIISGEISVGRIKAHISARHALITDIILELAEHKTSDDDAVQDTLEKMALTMKGLRYESLEGAENLLGDSMPPDLAWEVLLWLRQAM